MNARAIIRSFCHRNEQITFTMLLLNYYYFDAIHTTTINTKASSQRTEILKSTKFIIIMIIIININILICLVDFQ